MATSQGLPAPRLVIELGKLRHNAGVITGWCRKAGIEVLAVTKGVRGDPRVARAVLAGGVVGLAESRLPNLRGLQDLRTARGHAGPRPRFLLLRAPSPAQASEAVSLSDGVLCASAGTAESLAQAAASVRPGRPYHVFVTVDLGDLREGVLPEELTGTAVAMDQRMAAASGEPDPARRAHVAGLATNLACLCGLIPTRAHLAELVTLARAAGEALDRRLSVSGGNTAVLPLLLRGEVPPGIDDLRVGEGILLGRESLYREALPGCHVDAFTFWGAVIEVGRKPTFPAGECAQDAFGHQPVFVDRGRRRRALVAAGRQDIVPEGLAPLEPGIEIVAGTSDHLVLDVEDYSGRLEVGSEIGFAVAYPSLLQAVTSPDVTRVYVGEA